MSHCNYRYVSCQTPLRMLISTGVHYGNIRTDANINILNMIAQYDGTVWNRRIVRLMVTSTLTAQRRQFN